MSSLTMVLARRRHPAGRRAPQPRLWLLTTAAARRHRSSPARSTSSRPSYREGLGYTTNVVGSAFYTLTGFHGVHVTVGIVMLMSLFVLSLRGQPARRAGRDGRDRRPVLALRRHRVDPDLHRRLPDPVGAAPMSTDHRPTHRRADADARRRRARRTRPTCTYIKIALFLAVLTGARGRRPTSSRHFERHQHAARSLAGPDDDRQVRDRRRVLHAPEVRQQRCSAGCSSPGIVLADRRVHDRAARRFEFFE